MADVDEVDVKRYYIDRERYDWVIVADHLRGVESIFHRNRMREITRLVRRHLLETTILDVGCGTGLILRGLPNTPIGLDINPWAIGRARLHAPRSHLIIADAEHIPIRCGVLSGVVCTETLEHLPNPGDAVSEIHRVLRPYGILIGSVPNRIFLWRFRVLSSTCPKEEPFHNMYGMGEVEGFLDKFRRRYMRYSLLRLNIIFIAQK